MGRPTIEGWSGWTPGRVVLAVVVAASFGVWIYALSGRADRVPLDTLDDPAFALAAEPICADAMARMGEIPNAAAATDPAERAAQIRAANVILDEMLDDLEALYGAGTGAVTGTDRDRAVIDTWLTRWRTILDDRRDYADRIEVDGSALFFISAEAGRRAEASIGYVADVNGMHSCVLPTDVG